jgi:threonine/homoserine/homoserine lactone efflux protein
MPGIDHYWVFLFSGLLLNLTPGQDTLYIVGRTMAQGRRAGMASALGIGAGSVIHTLAAAFGLSYLLLHSAWAFEIVRYAGAAYLVLLGVRMLRRPALQAPADAATPARALFRTGLLTNLLNPKVALFYLSFLPQFIDPHNAYGALPFLILGFTFVLTGTAWCLVLAWSASFFGAALRKQARWQVRLHRVTGAVFIALGIRVALQDAR